MARANNRANQKTILPSLSPKDAMALLRRQYDKGKKVLDTAPFQFPDYNGWQNTTQEFLIKAFGSESGNVKEFRSIGQIVSIPYDDPGPDYWQQRNVNRLTSELQILDSAIEQLEALVNLEVPDLEKESLDVLNTIERVCIKFHRVARQLAKRYGDRQNLVIND